MNILIQVDQLLDWQEISFSSIVLTHGDCNGHFSKHRQGLSETYTLHCICGLEIVIKASEGAKELIQKIAVGAEAVELDHGSYLCNRAAKSIVVVPVIPTQNN